MKERKIKKEGKKKERKKERKKGRESENRSCGEQRISEARLARCYLPDQIRQFQKTCFKSGFVRPCLDTVDIHSRRLEEIGPHLELRALEGGKLPGTALEVFNQRLKETKDRDKRK